MSKCNNCGKENKKDATVCVSCGEEIKKAASDYVVYEYDASQKRGKKKGIRSTIITLVIVALFAICSVLAVILAQDTFPEEDSTPTYTVQFVKPTRGELSGSGDYEEGNQATVRATPYDGYRFRGWYKKVPSADGSKPKYELVSRNRKYKFTVEKDIVLKAKFKKDRAPESTTQANQ